MVLLFLGISLVQLDSTSASSTAKTDDQNPVFGGAAVIIASITSGFAGVYFERLLKASAVSVWMRNIQLGVFGALFGAVLMAFNDGAAIASSPTGLWTGFNGLVWGVILNQAVGGLIIAVVIKYADNILKGFASSFSIILSSMLAVVFFEFPVHSLFVAGTMVVLFSIYLYEEINFNSPPQTSPILPK